MPAGHQLCIVLLPNLISVGACMPQHHADIARMEADRILSVHASMPFNPGVILPQGSIGKIHEPDKRRRITDAGAPRAPLTSRLGTAVASINVSVLTLHKDGSSPLEAERKPRFCHVRGDAAILNSAARRWRTTASRPRCAASTLRETTSRPSSTSSASTRQSSAASC
jgi:hypothetical protein